VINNLDSSYFNSKSYTNKKKLRKRLGKRKTKKKIENNSSSEGTISFDDTSMNSFVVVTEKCKPGESKTDKIKVRAKSLDFLNFQLGLADTLELEQKIHFMTRLTEEEDCYLEQRNPRPSKHSMQKTHKIP